jgi:hypothetical protein
MLPHCKLVRFLEELRNSTQERGAVGLSVVAKAALGIIRDICDESMLERDIACLADLVAEIHNEGYTGLYVYLKEDAPDCEICAALARHLQLTN